MTTRTATKTESPAEPETLSTRARRGELLSAACPSRDVLKHVTSRWGTLLLLVLMGGVHRFSELRRKIGGVSEKMLAQSLKWLEADGLVTRTSYPTVPPHVEYALTPLGQEVGKHVASLADWIESNLSTIMATRREQALPTPQAGRPRLVRGLAGKSPSAGRA